MPQKKTTPNPAVAQSGLDGLLAAEDARRKTFSKLETQPAAPPAPAPAQKTADPGYIQQLLQMLGLAEAPAPPAPKPVAAPAPMPSSTEDNAALMRRMQAITGGK